MKNRKTLYLSLPITGTEETSKKTAHEARLFYERQGFKVFNPHDIRNQFIKDHGRIPIEPEIMGEDLKHLGYADAMILFPGWQQSQGCQFEIAFANTYNIPIYQLKQNKLIEFSTRLNNSPGRIRTDNWITQPLHIEEPVSGMPILN